MNTYGSAGEGGPCGLLERGRQLYVFEGGAQMPEGFLSLGVD